MFILKLLNSGSAWGFGGRMGFPRDPRRVLFFYLKNNAFFGAHYFGPTANLNPDFLASDYDSNRI